MVARSEDKPRSTSDRVDHAFRRIDELSRALNNGSPSLYNTAGHLLTLDAGSATPFLVPRDTDSAFRFDQGSVAITDPTGTEDRDMTVRVIHASGSMGTAGNLIASGDVNVVGSVIGSWVHSTGNINADTSIGAGLNVIAGGNVQGASGSFGPLSAGACNVGGVTCNYVHASGDILAPGLTVSTDNNGVMRSLNYYGGTFHGVFDNTSDARLKHHHEPITDADLDRMLEAPVDSWEYRTGDAELGDRAWKLPEGRRVGMVAQDAPELLQRTGEDGYLELDQASTVGMLHALVKRLSSQVANLQREVTELRAHPQAGPS